MLGNIQKKNDYLVSVSEAMKLSKYADVTTLDYVKSIRNAFINEIPKELEDDVLISSGFPLVLLFEIGRVQGIREERAKRKAKRITSGALSVTNSENKIADKSPAKSNTDELLDAIRIIGEQLTENRIKRWDEFIATVDFPDNCSYTERTAIMLRSLREMKGVTIEEVAEAVAGSCSESIKAYETGLRMPRDEIKLRLASYYDMNVWDMFPKSTLA